MCLFYSDYYMYHMNVDNTCVEKKWSRKKESRKRTPTLARARHWLLYLEPVGMKQVFGFKMRQVFEYLYTYLGCNKRQWHIGYHNNSTCLCVPGKNRQIKDTTSKLESSVIIFYNQKYVFSIWLCSFYFLYQHTKIKILKSLILLQTFGTLFLKTKTHFLDTPISFWQVYWCRNGHI